MIRQLILIAAMVGMTLPTTAQYIKAYGNTSSPYQITGGEMIELADGSFIQYGTDYNYNYGDISVVHISAAGLVLWQKHYGLATSAETGLSATQLDDNTVVIGGWTSSDFGMSEFSSYFIRIAPSNGYLYWAKTVPAPAGTASNGIWELAATSGNCFVATGDWHYDFDSPDVFVFKMNSLGVLQWQRTYHLNVYEVGDVNSIGRGINENPDGSLIVTGTINGLETFLMKLSSTGTFLWAKEYAGVAGSGSGECARQTSDLGYIVTGHDGGYNHTFKTDASGNLTWSKLLTSDAVHGSDVIQTSDGGYAVADSKSLIKLSSAGVVSWVKAYHGGLGTVIQLSTGEYMLTGGTTEFGFTHGAYLRVKTDAAGVCCGTLPASTSYVAHTTAVVTTTATTLTPLTFAVSSSVVLPTTNTEVSMCNCTANAGPDQTNENRACCTPGGCTSVVLGTSAIAGYAYSWSGGPFTCTSGTCNQINANPCTTSTYKVTASASGCLTSYDYATVTTIYVDCCGPKRLMGPDNNSDASTVNIYPNPAHDHLTVELSENTTDGKIVTVEISDMQGKRMFYQEYTSDQRTIQIDFNGFSAGLYVVNVNTGAQTVTQKISVQ